MKLVLRCIVVLVASLLLAELVLQVASFFAPDRDGNWLAGARTRVLCVGDSHTWGAGVAREEAYPQQLERLLEAHAPGDYSVLNLGLPGMNTAQVRRRTPVWLSRYEPDVLIVWAGVNNMWNVADVGDQESTPWLERVALRSRVWRLVSVTLHDRALEHYAANVDDDASYDIVDRPAIGEADEQRFAVRHDDVIEQVRHRTRPHNAAPPEVGHAVRRAEADYEAIADLANAAGVDLVFVTYPSRLHPVFGGVSRAMRRVGRAHDVPVIDSVRAVRRIPRDERAWLWAGHPSGPMYREIARDLVPVLTGHATNVRSPDEALWGDKSTYVQVPSAPPFALFLDPNDVVLSRRIALAGVWEPNETHWTIRFLEEGDTFIDVGANVGYYTLLAAKLVGESGRVFAFEPEPAAFALLERSVLLNWAYRVAAKQMAAAAETGPLELFLAEEDKGDHRIFQTEESRPAIEVDAVRLDEYLARWGGRIDFVKIDTHGAEALVVAGLAETIAANPDIVLTMRFWPYALDRAGSDPARLLARLREHDFRIFDLGPREAPVQEPREVKPEWLTRALTVANERATTLLLVKGFDELRRLTWDTEGKRRALATMLAQQPGDAEGIRNAREALATAEAALTAHTNGALPASADPEEPSTD